MYFDQWFLTPWQYIDNQDRPYDHSILPVWIQYQLFGLDVKVMVIDSGVETGHDDLVDNYHPQFGWGLTYNRPNPNPDPKINDPMIKMHGTGCAGIIAMKANNRKCGVGIAPLVTLGAVELGASSPRGDDTTPHITTALQFQYEYTDITTNSYSLPRSRFGTILTSVPTENARKITIDKGRGGKGIIHLYAAGNDKRDGFSCAGNALLNSVFTIGVASTTVEGQSTWYSESCTAVIVTVFSSQGTPDDRYRIPTTTLNNECFPGFGHTSGATPIAAGIIALAINANPNLTWRCMLHLIATTSTLPESLLKTGTWARNDAGFMVSPDFGFGFMDAYNLVTAALFFQPVPPMRVCIIPIYRGKPSTSGVTDIQNAVVGLLSDFITVPVVSTGDGKGLPFGHDFWINQHVNVDACRGTAQEVNFLESVGLMVSITYPKLGNVTIQIKSPKGTTANVLPRQKSDFGYRLDYWQFKSVMTWGESPRGSWTIRVMDTHGHSGLKGEVSFLSLILTGTLTKPSHYGPEGEYRPFDSFAPHDFVQIMHPQ